MTNTIAIPNAHTTLYNLSQIAILQTCRHQATNTLAKLISHPTPTDNACTSVPPGQEYQWSVSSRLSGLTLTHTGPRVAHLASAWGLPVPSEIAGLSALADGSVVVPVRLGFQQLSWTMCSPWWPRRPLD